MTKTRLKKATETVYTILKQIARWVPRDLVKGAAERHGIRYRTFDPWSHLVTLLVVQLSREESLNGICDIAQAMSYEWDRAGMEIPRRNTLSNANAKGDILVADRAYLDMKFLCALALRGVFFTVRQKTNLLLDVAGKLQEPCVPDVARHTTQILADEKVRPATAASAAKYTADGGCLRRVTALVEVDGDMRRMVFLTNNFAWSARTIAELYKARWEVETFFKELKQTCQIHDFIGYSENAVKWQVWAGLIAHLLLRFTRHLAKWGNSFSRLAGIVRGCLWLKKDLFGLLDTYGTASGWVFRRKCARPAWIQALLPFANAPNGTP